MVVTVNTNKFEQCIFCNKDTHQLLQESVILFDLKRFSHGGLCVTICKTCIDELDSKVQAYTPF